MVSENYAESFASLLKRLVESPSKPLSNLADLNSIPIKIFVFLFLRLPIPFQVLF